MTSPAHPFEALDAAAVSRLPLSWRSRFEPGELASLIRSGQAWGAWEPGSGEFVVARPWRHRSEIAVLVEIAAVRRADELVLDIAARCRDDGRVLLMAMEQQERRRSASWERAGLRPLEDVIAYELTSLPSAPASRPGLSFHRVRADDAGAVGTLLALDRVAFPWLWWNSVEEFASYLGSNLVEAAIGTLDGEPVCYVGLTRYTNATHLDRIAVRPDRQGEGIGRAGLTWVIDRVRVNRAAPLGLSTQRTNARSRALYESLGFRRKPGDDYRIYGRWLVDRDLVPGADLD